MRIVELGILSLPRAIIFFWDVQLSRCWQPILLHFKTIDFVTRPPCILECWLNLKPKHIHGENYASILFMIFLENWILLFCIMLPHFLTTCKNIQLRKLYHPFFRPWRLQHRQHCWLIYPHLFECYIYFRSTEHSTSVTRSFQNWPNRIRRQITKARVILKKIKQNKGEET